METKMQTSFIPKKPIVATPDESRGISLFLLLAIIIFIVSLAMAGGVFLWKDSLVKKIAEDKVALESEKQSYEEKTIDFLIRLDDRIRVSEELLSRHLAVSPVFYMLEKSTLQKVRLKTMKFSYNGDKGQIDLTGLAQSYATLANSNQSYEVLSKQSDSFGAENLRTLISQPVISDFSPTADGSVAFSFSATVNPGLVSYAGVATSSVSVPQVNP
jgi:hypothetical protein